MLVELKRSDKYSFVGCFLCRVILGTRVKASFGCEQCMKGYHVNFFAILHHLEHFQDRYPYLVREIYNSMNQYSVSGNWKHGKQTIKFPDKLEFKFNELKKKELDK